MVVEAKGRAGEFASGGCKASSASLEKIRSAGADVQASLGVPPNPTWLRAYYQMANRLAYLWFARRHGDERPLWLVWIYVTGETYRTVTGPTAGPSTPAEWALAVKAAKTSSGSRPSTISAGSRPRSTSQCSIRSRRPEPANSIRSRNDGAASGRHGGHWGCCWPAWG